MELHAKDLQIGDWVSETIVGIHQWSAEDYQDFDERYITPIPLTAEILEKNGFRYEQDYGQYYHSILGDYSKDKEPVINIGWNPSGEMYAYDICGGNNTACYGHRALYVHELQHGLRLCGLTELADTLII